MMLMLVNSMIEIKLNPYDARERPRCDDYIKARDQIDCLINRTVNSLGKRQI